MSPATSASACVEIKMTVAASPCPCPSGQVPRELQAVLLAEEDVDQDDVGTQGLDEIERFSVGRGDGGDAQTLSCQEGARNLEERFVVIDDRAPSRHAVSVAPIRLPRITASRNSTRRGSGARRSGLPAMTARARMAMVPGKARQSGGERYGIDRRPRRAWIEAIGKHWPFAPGATEQLRHVSLPYILAEAFADLVDSHAIADLVDRGCSLGLAPDIVR